MPIGKNAPVLTFDSERGIVPGDDLPSWVREIVDTATATEDYDIIYAFGEMMQDAGAETLESYGAAKEGLDVWRLPENEPGWLIVHWDGDDCDAFFYIKHTTDYMEFQSQWVAPMAQKIMATERYMVWKHELERREERAPRVH
jgi:hypothetical protein